MDKGSDQFFHKQPIGIWKGALSTANQEHNGYDLTYVKMAIIKK